MNSYSTANMATRPAAVAITATTSSTPPEKKYKVVIKIPSARDVVNRKHDVRGKNHMNLQQLASTPVSKRHEVHYKDQKNQIKTLQQLASTTPVSKRHEVHDKDQKNQSKTLQQLASTPVRHIVQAHSFSKKKTLSMREIAHGWW